jgi:DNA-binding XRE family transcriptional regulator
MRHAQFAPLVEGRLAATSGRGRLVRESAGLNQSDLAKLVGVTPATINRWEAGERRPSGPHAVAYARALRRIAEVAHAA